MLTNLGNSPNTYISNTSPIDIVRGFCPDMTELSEVSSDGQGNIHLVKDETNNPTGAYKWRGSAVKLTELFANGVDKVVTASAGNHGQGIAWVAGRLGGSADVFVPIGTPQTKLDGLERLGANIHLVGSNFDEATAYARAHASLHGTHFVHPFDDLAVMAGQSTIADELAYQIQQKHLDPLDTVYFVPVGGGGLLGGFAQRIKQLSRGASKVIGVQVDGSDSAALSFGVARNCRTQNISGGYMVNNPSEIRLDSAQRIAATSPNNDVDGTRVSVVGEHCLPSIVANVDTFIVVDPAELGRFYVQNPGSHLEPAGALARVGANLYAEQSGSSLLNLISLQTGRNQDPARIANLVARFRDRVMGNR